MKETLFLPNSAVYASPLVDALLCPQNLEVNRTQALLLEAKARCFRKWYQDYSNTIKAAHSALNIYVFHMNMENFVDIKDILRIHSEIGVNYIARNHKGDREVALNYIKQAIDVLDNTTIPINPLLSGKLYYDYGHLLNFFYRETTEIVRALSTAKEIFQQCGSEYDIYVEEISSTLQNISNTE